MSENLPVNITPGKNLLVEMIGNKVAQDLRLYVELMGTVLRPYVIEGRLSWQDLLSTNGVAIRQAAPADVA